MNLLPRVLALALLLVLAALAAMLAGPALRAPVMTTPSASVSANNGAPPPARQFSLYAQRIAFPLALTGVALGVALVASLAFRAARAADTAAPFSTTRSDVGALARLAESSNAQSEALARERSVRQRAEADALLHQQQLNRSLEDKIRLGRDLHDGIIQSLYAAGLTIESARAVAAADPAEADRRLARCLAGLNQSIRDVRAYIAGLAPANLRHAGFAQTLEAAAGELSAGRNVRVDLQIDEAATLLLTPEQNVETLQIAREAISNSLRHGAPSHIAVRLLPGENNLCLLVQDDGRGFDPTHHSGSGHGLANMQARAQDLGGSLKLESAPGKGTRLLLTLPLRTA